MNTKEKALANYLKNFASLTESEIQASMPFWRSRTIKKGDYFNMQSMVCSDLGLVVQGIFRIYYRDDEKQEEKNLFFFSENQFVVSFRSFISRNPCWYFIEAMEDAEIVSISCKDLNNLYESSPAWSRFGRLLAELFFSYAQTRAEEFVFFSHEQRYVRL